MTEQLWYTWTATGLGGNTGYQVRAASRNLRESQNKRFQAFRPFLNYTLPQGTDPSMATTANSPITLVFLDMGKTAMPEGYTNTHIVMQKVLKGFDANGRPGVFFIHLMDALPQDFLASDAIDLWASQFWRVSDDPPPSSDHSLPQFQVADLPPGKFADYRNTVVYPYHTLLEKCLPYVIRAYLSLKPEQKLYIIAPSEQVAVLIWGLAHSLPRSLQRAQNLTFSTYEKEVNQVSARVVGTCRADARVLYKNSGNRQQQPLPSNVFTGSGPALAIDCESEPLVKAEPPATEATDILTWYANHVLRELLGGRKQELTRKLEKATENGIVDLNGFISFIKTHIYEKELTSGETLALLNNPKQAAGDLSSANARSSLTRHWLEKAEWRKKEALPALERLRSLTDIGNKTLNANEKARLKGAFLSLATDALDVMVENVQDDAAYEASMALLTLCATEETEVRLQIYLLAQLQQRLQRPSFDQIQAGLRWNKRYWLLQQAAHISMSGAAQVDIRLISLWLPHSWERLFSFLEEREKFPENWPGRAISKVIYTTLTSGKSFPTGSAKRVLEKYPALLFNALEDLLQSPETQQAALQFCVKLLNAIVERKQGLRYTIQATWEKTLDLVLFIPRTVRADFVALFVWLHLLPEPELETHIASWQDIVPPILELKVGKSAPPINLDALLKAAQLTPEDQYMLLERYPAQLLSDSHLFSPGLAEICRTFLDVLLNKAEHLTHKSSPHLLYSSRVRYALEYLKYIKISDEHLNYDVNDLLCLVVTGHDEDFERFLQDNNDFLSNMVEAIKRFDLLRNRTYMENLYRLLIRIPRSRPDLEFITAGLAPVFEPEKQKKKQQSKARPEHELLLFSEIVSYAQKKGKHPIDTLLPYLEFALVHAEGLDERGQKSFLEPVLQNLADSRNNNYSLQNFDKKVQTSFPAHLELWLRYGPRGVKKQVNVQAEQSAVPYIEKTVQATQPATRQQPDLAQEDQLRQQQARRDYENRLRQQQAQAELEQQRRQQAENERVNWLKQQQAQDELEQQRRQQDAEADREMQRRQQDALDREIHYKYTPGHQLPAPITYPAEEVVITLLNQPVTKKQIFSIALACHKYVPARIKQLDEQANQLNHERRTAENKGKMNEVEQIKLQQYKISDEKEILEDYCNKTDNDKIQQMLENNILIDRYVTAYPDAHNLYITTFSQDYQQLKASKSYKQLHANSTEEGNIEYLFSICMKYCAFSSFLRQQSQDEMQRWTIKAWIKNERAQYTETAFRDS